MAVAFPNPIFGCLRPPTALNFLECIGFCVHGLFDCPSGFLGLGRRRRCLKCFLLPLQGVLLGNVGRDSGFVI